MLIYKLLRVEDWQAAEEVGAFHGSAVDLADGYLHFSTADQVVETAARHFAALDGIALLTVDSDRLGDALRFEPSRGGALFPHLYAPLPVDAVLARVDLPAGVPIERAVADALASTVVERVGTARGELVLRRRDDGYEVISNGVFLMDTRSGESERLLVRAALEAAPAARRVLIGGLGVGFSLAEAVRSTALTAIVVVEIEPALAAWHRTHLRPFSAGALDDPRVRLIQADLLSWLADHDERFDAICLDIDNGPDWTVFDGNTALYGDAGTGLLRAHLTPGGVLAVWSAAPSPGYTARLERLVGPTSTRTVPVPRGDPDHVFLATWPGDDPN